MPSDSTLTLFIPDLFGFQSTLNNLSAEEKSSLPLFELPILEKWISRGNFENSSNQEGSVFSELGLTEYKNKDVPFAALSLLAEDTSSIEINRESFWLRADPINLQADGDTALLAGHEELDLTQDEADKLVSQINSHFSDEPWQLYSFAPHRWYLRLDKTTDLQTTPLTKVLGGHIHEFGPSGEDADYWLKIINELQMLIHGSSVNFERESRNMWTVNSLWLWGGGYLSKVDSTSNYEKMITNNKIHAGIGYHCGIDVYPLDDAFSRLIKRNSNFVILDMLSEQVQKRDLHTFVKILNKLEYDFFVTCNTLLLNKTLQKIKIIADGGVITVTRKQLKYWWKWVQPFSGYINE